MTITGEMLQQYVGGQLEIQNPGERYLFRGEVNAIFVNDDQLLVQFGWMARAEGYPPLPKKWVNDHRLEYGLNLQVYSASNIGPGNGGGDDRIRLSSSATGETVIFYPPNGSKLDPAKVEGLKLTYVSLANLDLTHVDLKKISCLKGTIIEIEGLGKEEVPIPCDCLLDGISAVYALFCRRPIFVDHEFQRRISVLGYNDDDKNHPLVKVRIAKPS